MERGKLYKWRNVYLADWRVERFIPHLFDAPQYGESGCGITAASLLTGVHPVQIRRLRSYSQKWMINTLLGQGLDVVKVPHQRMIKGNIKSLDFDHLNESHVLLFCQLFRKTEASWSVAYYDRIYHNFVIDRFTGLELLNRTVRSVLLVRHPKWMR